MLKIYKLLVKMLFSNEFFNEKVKVEFLAYVQVILCSVRPSRSVQFLDNGDQSLLGLLVDVRPTTVYQTGQLLGRITL